MNMQKIYPQVRGKVYSLLRELTLRKLKTTLSLFAAMMLVSLVFGQDLHYSQFHNAPFTFNPALTGIMRGDIRAMGNYRGQWQSVPVDYTTFTLAADMNFQERYYKEGFFSAGIAFNHDLAGWSRLQLHNLGLTGSYTKKLSSQVFASIGLQLSANQRAFKLDDLSFDSQYNPSRGIYDSTLPQNEPFIDRQNFFFDVGAGINLRFQSHDNAALVDRLDKRSKMDIGLGISHINMADQSFTEGVRSALSMRISPYLMGTVKLTDNLDLVGNFLAQFQDPYREYVAMGGAKIHINRTLGRQLAVQLNFGYRFNDDFGDGVFPGIELFYNGRSAVLTYDINLTDFERATNGRGGPEFSLRYIIRRVRATPFRACPLM